VARTVWTAESESGTESGVGHWDADAADENAEGGEAGGEEQV